MAGTPSLKPSTRVRSVSTVFGGASTISAASNFGASVLATSVSSSREMAMMRSPFWMRVSSGGSTRGPSLVRMPMTADSGYRKSASPSVLPTSSGASAM
jgi:hypothetical protein